MSGTAPLAATVPVLPVRGSSYRGVPAKSVSGARAPSAASIPGEA